MLDFATPVPDGQSPVRGLDGGTELGKRYTADEPDSTLELLATKAGQGTLSVGGEPLIVKIPKSLPASD